MRVSLALMLLVVVLPPAAWGSVVIHDGREGIVATHDQYALDDSGRFWDLDLSAGWSRVPSLDPPVPVAQISFWTGTWFMTTNNHAWGHSTSDGWVDLGQWPASAVPEATPDAANAVVAPNPAAGPCSVSFTISQTGLVSVVLFDAGGRAIRTLLSTDLPAGTYSPTWDGRDDSGAEVPSGVCFAKITTAEGGQTIKFVLTR